MDKNLNIAVYLMGIFTKCALCFTVSEDLVSVIKVTHKVLH